MGTIDANGVWQYTNDDHVTPLATFMNMGQTSVSNALGDLRSDLTYPTSSASVSLHSGFTASSGTQWRKSGIGGVVISVQLGTVTSGTVIGTLGGVYRPQFTTYVTLGLNAANASAFLIINPTTGSMTLHHYSAADWNYARGGQSWPLD